MAGWLSLTHTNGHQYRGPATMSHRTPLAIDRTSTLDINGSLQSIRLCAARAGLPPLLIVQGGPGLPVLHEVPKFQRLPNLENAFLVCYWDQRGCGNASANDAHGVSRDDSRSLCVRRARRADHGLHGDGIACRDCCPGRDGRPTSRTSCDQSWITREWSGPNIFVADFGGRWHDRRLPARHRKVNR